MESVYRPISQWLLREPKASILRHEGSTITQEELLHQVFQLHYRLIQSSAQNCALFFQDSRHFIVALLAVLHAGKTPILLGHHNVAQLSSSAYGYDLLLTDNQKIQSINCWFTPNDKNNSFRNIQLGDIRPEAKIVLYTSGSSGVPKRIEKSVAIMDMESKWLAELWQNQFQATTVRGSVNHQHLYGLTFCIWLPLSMGYLIDSELVEFPEQLTYMEPYIFITSPAFLQFIDYRLNSPAWSFIISAGGKLEYVLAEKTLRWGKIPIHEIYGSTETGIVGHRALLAEDSQWQLFSAVSLYPKGEGLYSLHSPLLTPLIEFPLEDKLHLADNGHFILQGRIDKIVKIGEKRISITLIENKLASFPNINDVAIVPIVRKGRTYLGAVIVVKPETDESKAQLISEWRELLREYTDPISIPRFWRIVPTIPLSKQSKRSWLVLQELFDVAH